jgi:hypothetical protein
MHEYDKGECLMSQSTIPLRKHLHADALLHRIRSGFDHLLDRRPGEIMISLADALMSALAMFSLKDPSLLAFDTRRKDEIKVKNLKTLYHIDTVPCDTQMREILDDVEPDDLSPIYTEIFRQVQRGKVLEKLVFMDGCYLLSADGTSYFSSKQIHCNSCLEKKNSKTGDVTYSHQMFAAAIVHPDFQEVIPVFPEPITTQDGATKNDCERNASKRFLAHFRNAHPHLGVIVVEDALSANAPHIRELRTHHMHFILGVKPGDHEFLFHQVDAAAKTGTLTEQCVEIDDVTHRFRCLNEVALNQSNQDVVVNFLEYWEIQPDGTTQHFAWVTDFDITRENMFHLMRGGRARWKIENETFNTLKNQGYHFAHNYGHGAQHLSVVFAVLMMLAFLVDQVQQLACQLFRAVWQKEGSKTRMWEHLRALFYSLEFESMVQLFQALLYGYRVERFVIVHDSS